MLTTNPPALVKVSLRVGAAVAGEKNWRVKRKMQAAAKPMNFILCEDKLLGRSNGNCPSGNILPIIYLCSLDSGPGILHKNTYMGWDRNHPRT